MTELQLSIGAGEIVKAIIALAAAYAAWSTKKVLQNYEANFDRLAKICEEHDKRMDQHETCLTKICIHHEHNHSQKVDCHL